MVIIHPGIVGDRGASALDWAITQQVSRWGVTALMEQEKRFLQALESVQRWDISPIEQIRFWPAEGKPLRWWLEEG